VIENEFKSKGETTMRTKSATTTTMKTNELSEKELGSISGGTILSGPFEQTVRFLTNLVAAVTG
jgi:bacteriocin-like protein